MWASELVDFACDTVNRSVEDADIFVLVWFVCIVAVRWMWEFSCYAKYRFGILAGILARVASISV